MCDEKTADSLELVPSTDVLYFSNMETYRTHKLAELAGVSVYQLWYWNKTGLVVPSVKETEGEGHARLYSEGDLVAARSVGKLRKKGVSLQKIRKAVAWLGKQMPGRNVLANDN